MGFYSTIEETANIKKEKVEEFRQKCKEMRERRNKGEFDVEYDAEGKKSPYKNLKNQYEFIDYFIDEDWLKIADDGSMDFNDWTGKFYGDEGFAVFIAPYVEEGRMIFCGEDGGKYGYEFDGKGKVFHLDFPDPIRGNEVEVKL